MTTRRLVKSLAAMSMTGVAVLGFQLPSATAQQGPPAINCPNPGGQYPPGQCRRTVSDNTPSRGQDVTVTSGSGTFQPGEAVQVRALGGETTAAADTTGNVASTFSVPRDARCGRSEVVFDAVSATSPSPNVSVPFTVTCAAVGAAGGRGSALPRTGADHIGELALAGMGLVAAGGAVAVGARRRRNEQAPAGLV